MKIIMTYGIGYQGSKNRIANDIIDILPPGNRFVDLFAGGCSVTHCAMLSGKYNRFLANDIDCRIPQTFKDAIEGKFENERRWISRDDFFKMKDSDMYVRLIFSFGNNQRGYMYSTNIEPYKKACHYAIAFYEWARTRDYPVYFSEYNAPDDFTCIWSKPICKMAKGGKSSHNKAIEKLFIHKRFAK